MDVDIIDEYVEPGRSATNMDRRPVFQAMMQRIQDERDIDYIIVYKLSRMNRNWAESAVALLHLQKRKVSLVSATENIDDHTRRPDAHGRARRAQPVSLPR